MAVKYLYVSPYDGGCPNRNVLSVAVGEFWLVVVFVALTVTEAICSRQVFNSRRMLLTYLLLLGLSPLGMLSSGKWW